MKSLIYAFSGAIIGSITTWFISKKIYEDKLILQAEEIHAYYESKKDPVPEPEKEENVSVSKKPSLEDTYGMIVKDYTKKVTEPPQVKAFGPYVISQDEAGREDENGEKYELLPTWEHYANDVLVDARDHVLTDEEIDHFVGLDYADHFGEVDDSDYLYIRNKELHLDIEIHDNGIAYSE